MICQYVIMFVRYIIKCFSYITIIWFVPYCICYNLTNIGLEHDDVNVYILTNYTFRYAIGENPMVRCIFSCHSCYVFTLRLYANESLLVEMNDGLELRVKDRNVGMWFYNENNDTKELGVKFFNSSWPQYNTYRCVFNISIEVYKYTLGFFNVPGVPNSNVSTCNATYEKLCAVEGWVNETFLWGYKIYYGYDYPDKYRYVGDSPEKGHSTTFNIWHNVSKIYYSRPGNLTCRFFVCREANATLWINMTDTNEQFKLKDNKVVNFTCSSSYKNKFAVALVTLNNTVFAGYNGTNTFLLGNSNNTVAVKTYLNKSIDLSVSLCDYNVYDVYKCLFYYTFTTYNLTIL